MRSHVGLARAGMAAGDPCHGTAAHRPVRALSVAAGLVLALALMAPAVAMAAGPDAILTPAGYDANVIARGDDTSNLVVNLPFSMNWNGTTYTQIYINMNGNCTFGSGYTGYNPNTTLAATNRNIMAPFWADVDTRNTAASQVTYSRTTAGSVPQVNGRNAFFVNWVDVASYNNRATPTNSFQLVIVDRSDTGAGNFDFMYNYDQIAWDIATAASTFKARAGWGFAGTGFELPGSGVAQASASTLLDSSPAATSLIQNSLNSGGQLGRYVWQVRGGAQPNIPPQVSVVDRTLEGNAPDSYVGYVGTGDASATDPDGTVTSFTHDRPSVLPLGTTVVTWTATDNLGAMTTAQQSILVRDTTPPTNPVLTSPSHSTEVWSSVSAVTVDSAGATDVCSGVRGFSYGFSQGAPAMPDTVEDPLVTDTVTTTIPTTVDSQTFPNNTWPAGWTRSSTTWVRLTNAAGRNRGTYAAEIWDDNNNATRRTANFYRDYDLTGFTSATLSFWNNVSALNESADYARVEYSTNNGTSWTQLENRTGAAGATGWQRREYALPAGGTVRVRFTGSVNRTDEYVNWDDITVVGFTSTTSVVLSTSTTTELADGMWYFNLRSVDNADNWSAPVSMGRFLIDTVAPVTTDDAPPGWSTTPVDVTLTPVDAGVIAYTQYALNGAAWSTYTGPVSVSTEGTNTLEYRSADEAGHVEVVRTATVCVDTQPPTVPTNVSASAKSTDEIEITWEPSTDMVSGLAYYAIYRDGVFIDTSASTTYVDEALTPGETYVYSVSAVDVAGNESPWSDSASETLPNSALWISVAPAAVDLGGTDPGDSYAVTDATTVAVGGIGGFDYDLLCNAQDFVNTDSGATMQTLPASALSFATGGFVTVPSQPFTTTPIILNSATGSDHLWSHEYVFDYLFVVPWSFEAGTYVTTVTYTAVSE